MFGGWRTNFRYINFVVYLKLFYILRQDTCVQEGWSTAFIFFAPLFGLTPNIYRPATRPQRKPNRKHYHAAVFSCFQISYRRENATSRLEGPLALYNLRFPSRELFIYLFIFCALTTHPVPRVCFLSLSSFPCYYFYFCRAEARIDGGRVAANEGRIGVHPAPAG